MAGTKEAMEATIKGAMGVMGAMVSIREQEY